MQIKGESNENNINERTVHARKLLKQEILFIINIAYVHVKYMYEQLNDCDKMYRVPTCCHIIQTVAVFLFFYFSVFSKNTAV